MANQREDRLEGMDMQTHFIGNLSWHLKSQEKMMLSGKIRPGFFNVCLLLLPFGITISKFGCSSRVVLLPC